ncbi:hypothetical protein K461DRAFT_56551 [Myriangium duriaei CBS 260.36]|uniref:Uncharacterized protein n=1 Tax=Myriangium duriaei CBS 260.36 TaxID=1168546 RepID=A0A9P4IY88_9PEZI|nr:hypothetical protein K461DRAFT_56551 [Myriangium duriaei CBS 260.36]
MKSLAMITMSSSKPVALRSSSDFFVLVTISCIAFYRAPIGLSLVAKMRKHHLAQLCTLVTLVLHNINPVCQCCTSVRPLHNSCRLIDGYRPETQNTLYYLWCDRKCGKNQQK